MPSLLIEPTVVFPIRFRYTITTIVIVEKNNKLDNMLLKAATITPTLRATTLGLGGDTSIANIDS